MRIGVAGCAGRMGGLLVQELLSGAWPGMDLAGGTVQARQTSQEGVFVTPDPETLLKRSDLLVDFTTPEATARHIRLAAKHGKSMVIGTTGLSAAQEKKIRDATRHCAILYAANMSLGTNLLLALAERASESLGPEWDAEILETHHRHKIDAPSGTALALGKAVERGGGRTPDLSPDRTGPRKQGSIGFAVRRGGDVAGEHTVSFFTTGERIDLSHTATDRTVFARGALRAAQWLAGKPAGLYSMRDVLRL